MQRKRLYGSLEQQMLQVPRYRSKIGESYGEEMGAWLLD
jgi:hypothetical protein